MSKKEFVAYGIGGDLECVMQGNGNARIYSAPAGSSYRLHITAEPIDQVVKESLTTDPDPIEAMEKAGWRKCTPFEVELGGELCITFMRSKPKEETVTLTAKDLKYYLREAQAGKDVVDLAKEILSKQNEAKASEGEK